MAITREEVLRIAELANLHLTEPEVELFTAQFQAILGYIEKLREIDTAGVEPTSHVSLEAGSGVQPLRADECRPSLPVEEVLASAPDAGRGHFKVPKVI